MSTVENFHQFITIVPHSHTLNKVHTYSHWSKSTSVHLIAFFSLILTILSSFTFTSLNQHFCPSLLHSHVFLTPPRSHLSPMLSSPLTSLSHTSPPLLFPLRVTFNHQSLRLTKMATSSVRMSWMKVVERLPTAPGRATTPL